MARRRGGTTSGRDSGGPIDPSEYYVSSESDIQYVKQTRRRLKQQTIRRVLIRLAILAVLVFAALMWGPDVLRAFRVQKYVTTEEFKGVSDHIRSGVDRRSGAGLEEE